MAIKIKKTEPGIRIDPDTYKAIVVGVKRGSHPSFGPNLLWELKIKSPTVEGRELDSDVKLIVFTSDKLTDSKRNKLNRLLLALGFETELNETVDVEKAIGFPLRVVVEDDEKEDGIYSKVTSFLPLKKKGKKEEDDDDDSKENTPEQDKSKKSTLSLENKQNSELNSSKELKSEKKNKDNDDDPFDFDNLE